MDYLSLSLSPSFSGYYRPAFIQFSNLPLDYLYFEVRTHVWGRVCDSQCGDRVYFCHDGRVDFRDMIRSGSSFSASGYFSFFLFPRRQLPPRPVPRPSPVSLVSFPPFEPHPCLPFSIFSSLAFHSLFSLGATFFEPKQKRRSRCILRVPLLREYIGPSPKMCSTRVALRGCACLCARTDTRTHPQSTSFSPCAPFPRLPPRPQSEKRTSMSCVWRSQIFRV